VACAPNLLAGPVCSKSGSATSIATASLADPPGARHRDRKKIRREKFSRSKLAEIFNLARNSARAVANLAGDRAA
jgi:hypothetical protein